MVHKGLKNFFFIIIVNLIILVFGIGLIELVFGGWIKADSLNRLNILRSRTIQFNIEGLYDSTKPTITYKRDEFGLRGDYGSPKEIDILTVGGSTTDQRMIGEGETWQDITFKYLEEKKYSLKIANAGVDGQSTFGHIKNFDWWFPHIPDLKPKYILFYIGLNDFYLDEGRGFDALVTKEEEKNLVHHLKEKSAMYFLLRTLFGIYQASFKQKISHTSIDFDSYTWTKKGKLDSYDELMKVRLKEYKERVTLLLDKTKGLGAKAIFVSQPSFKYKVGENGREGIASESSYKDKKINGVDYYFMLRKLDQVLGEVASLDQGAIFIDLNAYDIWQKEDFYDFAHMTPKGAHKLGKLLAEELVKVLPGNG